MKVKVFPPDGDTDYFNIAAGVLQGDTLAPYLLIICLDYLLMKWKTDKGKKQEILCTYNYRHGLHQWHSASGKYTHPSWNPAT